MKTQTHMREDGHVKVGDRAWSDAFKSHGMPMIAGKQWKLAKAGRIFPHGYQKEHGLAGTLILDFWTSELGDNKLYLF